MAVPSQGPPSCLGTHMSRVPLDAIGLATTAAVMTPTELIRDVHIRTGGPALMSSGLQQAPDHILTVSETRFITNVQVYVISLQNPSPIIEPLIPSNAGTSTSIPTPPSSPPKCAGETL